MTAIEFKKIRLKLNFSQEKFAKEIGISSRMIIYLEKGICKIRPQTEILLLLLLKLKTEKLKNKKEI